MVCAKVEGERCGGPWNIAGVCDKGLICSPKSDLRPGRCIDRMYISKPTVTNSLCHVRLDQGVIILSIRPYDD